MPVEPRRSPWEFPDPSTADAEGLVGIGADLEPGTVLAAYRHGLYPMPVQGSVGWWSPDPRGVLPLAGLRVSRSLRRSTRRYRVSVDTAFADVVAGCADPSRPHGWIDGDIAAAYEELHRLGWAHSIEVRDEQDDLVGGLYGVGIGGFFAGESMFHRATDASKVALVHLVELLIAGGAVLLDVQMTTPHLRSLGAIDLPRSDYLDLLPRAIARPVEPFAAAADGDRRTAGTGAEERR